MVVFLKGTWNYLVLFLKGIWSSHSGVSEDASSLGMLELKFIENVASRKVGNYLSVGTL
jgi:hypothetical protein